MTYYAVLEATDALIARHQWTLQRCRRCCDGPTRYVVFDEHRSPVLVDSDLTKKRLGWTLQELLVRLCELHEHKLATTANHLLTELNKLIDYE